MIEDRILTNLNLLINEGNKLKIGNEHEQVKSNSHLQNCQAWIAAAAHTMELIFPNKKDSYRDCFLKLSSRDHGYIVNQ